MGLLRNLALALLGAVAASLTGSPVEAATPLFISPTLVEIAPTRRSAAMEITNQSDAPVDLQVRGYDWSQPGGADRLVPSDAIAISPAIATVPPRAKQLFRILLLGPPSPGEQAWRIRINELPQSADRSAVAVNLEFLVPAFRTAAGAAPDLRWSRTAGGIEFENRGSRRVRLLDATMATVEGRRVPIAGASPTYILAGARRVLPAPPLRVDRVVATTDLGQADVARSDAAP